MASNGDGWVWDDSGRVGARLEVGEGGGGVGEGAHARNRGRVAGGRRAVGDELSSALSEGRRKRKLSEIDKDEKE